MVPIHLKRLSPSGNADTPFSPDIMSDKSSCCSRLLTECLSLGKLTWLSLFLVVVVVVVTVGLERVEAALVSCSLLLALDDVVIVAVVAVVLVVVVDDGVVLLVDDMSSQSVFPLVTANNLICKTTRYVCVSLRSEL